MPFIRGIAWRTPFHTSRHRYRFKYSSRMEQTTTYSNSGNVTADFLDQILTNGSSVDIFDRKYIVMDDDVLNDRLTQCFQKFFYEREIKLHFIPGIVVKVVPNSENAIKLSVKRAFSESLARRTKPYEYMIQFGVPALMMPAILMGTVLPFLLPALKVAAIATGLINKGALMAAVMYAAKSATQGHENKAIYYNPGYHRDI